MKKLLLILLLTTPSVFAELYYNNITNTYYCANFCGNNIDQIQYNALFKEVIKQKHDGYTTYHIYYYLTLIGTETSLQLRHDMKEWASRISNGRATPDNWLDYISLHYVPKSDCY